MILDVREVLYAVPNRSICSMLLRSVINNLIRPAEHVFFGGELSPGGTYNRKQIQANALTNARHARPYLKHTREYCQMHWLVYNNRHTQ